MMSSFAKVRLLFYSPVYTTLIFGTALLNNAWHADQIFRHGTLNFRSVNAKLRVRVPLLFDGQRPLQGGSLGPLKI
jgi:hypothetical protein